MVRSMFAGISGLRSHQTKMDVIGNNIANVNTYGFKASRATFSNTFYQTLSGATAPGGAYGGANAKQIGYGAQVGSIDVLHTSGSMVSTDNASDIMINGSGFFLVGADVPGGVNPNEVTQLQLTRVGVFRFDSNGSLVDSSRNMVYGFQGYSIGESTTNLAGLTLTAINGNKFTFAADGTPTLTPSTGDAAADATAIAEVFEQDATTGEYTLKSALNDTTVLVPITFPTDPTTGETLKIDNISFGADGTITGIDENDNIINIGKVAVANVPNESGLEQSSSSNYTATSNSGTITAHVPGEGTTGSIQSSVLESSNVDMSREFTEMITTQRGFQANTKIITVSDSMLEELVNLKR